MSQAGFGSSIGAIASPWRSACDRVDALPHSADVAILAVLILAVGATERLRRGRL